MATPEVTPLPRRLPETIKVDLGGALTPNEMRTIKFETGRPLNELLGGDPEDLDAAPDRIQSFVWITLRRAGYSCSWEEAGDVLPDYAKTEPDPTPTGPSDSSSSSATSGA